MLGTCPSGSQKRQGQNITGLPLAFPVVRVLLLQGERFLMQENTFQRVKDASPRVGDVEVIAKVIDVATP